MATQLCNLGSNFNNFCYSIYDPIKDDIYILGSLSLLNNSTEKLYLKKYNKTTGLNLITSPLIINSKDYVTYENDSNNVRYYTFLELCDMKVLGDYVYLFFGGTLNKNSSVYKNYLQIIKIDTTNMSQIIYYEKYLDIPTNKKQDLIIGCLDVETTKKIILGIYKFTENQLYYVDFQNIDPNTGEYVETLISSNLGLNANNKCISSVKLIGNYIYYFVLKLELRKVDITDGTIHYVFTPDNSNLYSNDSNRKNLISHKIHLDTENKIWLKPSNIAGGSETNSFVWYYESYSSSSKYCYILSQDDNLITKFIIQDKFFYKDPTILGSNITFIDSLLDKNNYCITKYTYRPPGATSPSSDVIYKGIYKTTQSLSTYSIVVKDLDNGKIYLHGYLTKDNATNLINGIYDFSTPNLNLLDNKWLTATFVGIYPCDNIVYNYFKNINIDNSSAAALSEMQKLYFTQSKTNPKVNLCSTSAKGIGLNYLPLFGSDNYRYCIAPNTLSGVRDYYKQYYLHFLPNNAQDVTNNNYSSLTNVYVDINPYPIKNIIFKNVTIGTSPNQYNGYYVLVNTDNHPNTSTYDIVGLYDKTKLSVNLLRQNNYPFTVTKTYLDANVTYGFDTLGNPINTYSYDLYYNLIFSNKFYPTYSDASGIDQKSIYAYNSSTLDSRVADITEFTSAGLVATSPITVGQTISEQAAKAKFTKWYNFKKDYFGTKSFEFCFQVTNIDASGVGIISSLFDYTNFSLNRLNDNSFNYKKHFFSSTDDPIIKYDPSFKFNTNTLSFQNTIINYTTYPNTDELNPMINFIVKSPADSTDYECFFRNDGNSVHDKNRFIFGYKRFGGIATSTTSSENLIAYNGTNGLYLEELKWKDLTITPTSGPVLHYYYCYCTKSGSVQMVRDYAETTPTNLLISGIVDPANGNLTSTGITFTGPISTNLTVTLSTTNAQTSATTGPY